MNITLVAGTRPNFMKIAPIIDAIKVAQSKGENIEYRLVHTGQHYEKNMIPDNSINKLPSAELRPDQVDPFDYDVVSPLVTALIDNQKSPSELIKEGADPGLVKDISNRIRINEYKRRQAAPGLRVTSKAFGIGRRVPIVNQFDELNND